MNDNKKFEEIRIETEKKAVNEMKLKTRIMFIAIIIVTAMVVFTTLYYMISFSMSRQVMKQQNCGIVQDHSDQITTEASYIFLWENIPVPYPIYETKYHSYLVCLNGTNFDRGYLP
jgi:hypothetical protein